MIVDHPVLVLTTIRRTLPLLSGVLFLNSVIFTVISTPTLRDPTYLVRPRTSRLICTKRNDILVPVRSPTNILVDTTLM